MYKKKLQYNRKFQGGFSLIELILVIALIGIFSTIAMTRTNTSLSVIRENIALDQITSDIDLVKSMAFAQNQTITLKFDVLNESYSVFNEQGIINDFPNSDESGIISLNNSNLRNTDIKQAVFGNTSDLEFTSKGSVINGGIIELNSKTITIESVSGRWSIDN